MKITVNQETAIALYHIFLKMPRALKAVIGTKDIDVEKLCDKMDSMNIWSQINDYIHKEQIVVHEYPIKEKKK